ncbi:general secretion pathway protein [Flavobacterium eburneipallidum]|uniref:general secretion pathway protein n=1 Tax=Flavobacterium eburneipallidum TaxID=3003263 RepID=UPI002482251A|nr:general secretion pathway protein [Flavobacterium eburneipallidum]
MRLNRKNKGLLFGFVVALYICYSFAISNTISYYKEYQSKSEMISENNSSPKLASQLRQKEKQLDVMLSRYNIKASESFQNDLLKQLTAYGDSYHLKIIDFKEPHSITEKGFTTTSYIFSLEGSFNGCLASLNKIENNPTLGSIKHLNFTTKKNYKTDANQLFVEVILQKNKGIK